ADALPGSGRAPRCRALSEGHTDKQPLAGFTRGDDRYGGHAAVLFERHRWVDIHRKGGYRHRRSKQSAGRVDADLTKGVVPPAAHTAIGDQGAPVPTSGRYVYSVGERKTQRYDAEADHKELPYRGHLHGS